MCRADVGVAVFSPRCQNLPVGNWLSWFLTRKWQFKLTAARPLLEEFRLLAEVCLGYEGRRWQRLPSHERCAQVLRLYIRRRQKTGSLNRSQCEGALRFKLLASLRFARILVRTLCRRWKGQGSKSSCIESIFTIANIANKRSLTEITFIKGNLWLWCKGVEAFKPTVWGCFHLLVVRIDGTWPRPVCHSARKEQHSR